jgi:hypothetical protein
LYIPLFNRSLGDSYSVDSDIQELVAYYDKEFERWYARSIVNGQTMLFVISKCVRPEVFPLQFIEDILAKIVRFLEPPARSVSVSSLISSESVSYHGDNHCYIDPRDLYNS